MDNILMDEFNYRGSKVHIIGICGVGISAIAKFLCDMGFIVSGSDISDSDERKTLIKKGVTVFYGHDRSNVIGADIVIYSSAVKKDNPELNYAFENGIPVFSRAEALAFIKKRFAVSIGVCGAHGKTTTTALIANVLKKAKNNFTAFIGGYDRALGNYVNLGKDILLIEVCEYKRNIDLISPDIGVILNVDDDHLDCYNCFDDLISAFRNFSLRSEYCIVNGDDPVIDGSFSRDSEFGLNFGDFSAENVTIDRSAGRMRFVVKRENEPYINANVLLKGFHNVYNVLAAVAVLCRLGIDKNIIEQGLKSYKGIKRRDEFLGELFGAKVYADYAHHPSEIEKYFKNYDFENSEICVLFQPHTYSRTKILFDKFAEVLKPVKNLIIFKTYAARESFDERGSAKALCDHLTKADYCDNKTDLITLLKGKLALSKILLVIGAGDIYDIVSDYIKKMRP